MVFVKVRETYDLHTTKDKMTVIGIHTPKPEIIKRNYPGLLMQCKVYRPVSCDVKVACASVLPLDPLGVGLESGSVAPEDVFNPILYKAMSNKGMSQLESRINMMRDPLFGVDVQGSSAAVDVDSVTDYTSDFNIYYGLLSQAHVWKHANPQAGLEMKGLRPLVYEMVYNVGDMVDGLIHAADTQFSGPKDDNDMQVFPAQRILGKSKEFPFIPCTSYTYDKDSKSSGWAYPGFPGPNQPANAEVQVPYLHVFCGCIIVPPSKLHEMFYRMVVEWTIEFSSIRPIGEIGTFGDLAIVGANTHYINYSYSKTKEVLTGTDETILENDSCMVDTNAEINKVM